MGEERDCALHLGEQQGHMELGPAVDNETAGSIWVTDERAE